MKDKMIDILRRFMIPILFVVLCLVFSILSPYFFTWNNLVNIFIQQSYVVVVAVGLSFVMISGGMDLSVGYQMSLVGVVTAMLMVNYNVPVPVAVCIGLVLGACLGAFNGLMAVTLNVHPLIITLATQTIFQGLSYTISGSKQIINLPDSFKFIGQGYIGPIPFAVILMVIVIVVASFILLKSKFGRYVYALGSNQDAAYLAGINIKKTRIVVFTITGSLVALATMILVARTGSAQSSNGPGTEFTAMTAAILGGISFIGGEGKITGVFLGVLLLGVLGNGMQLINMGTYAQYIVRGFVLLAAVGFDMYQKRKLSQAKKVEEPKAENA